MKGMISATRARLPVPTGLSAIVTVLSSTVLLIHTGAAFAQQPPVADPAAQAAPSGGEGAPAPEAPAQEAEAAPVPDQPGAAAEGEPAQYPPGYGPPPGYAAPPGPGAPPGYAYPPPPRRYAYYPPPPPPAQPVSTERTIMLGGSIGLAGLHFHDLANQAMSAPATGYSARLGLGVAPRMLFLLGVDGAVTNDDLNVFDQTIYYAGLQAFVTRQLFLRGGVGIGNITARDSWDFLQFGKAGLGLTGSVGIELVQGYNWSLELAGQATGGFYKDSERWASYAVNLGFNFF